MMKLSDRLQRIADEINQGETMADIGTDHGFLPVSLMESGKCAKVIMADISAASLEKAKETARQRGYRDCNGEGMEFRTGNGLSVLSPFEVDSVVIAGMGGKLIRNIMAADQELTRSFRTFVLQPRIGQGHLRKWLAENGFHIVNECVVKEGRHIPEIITARSPEQSFHALEWAQSQDGREDLLVYARRTMPDLVKLLDGADGNSVLWRVPPWMVYANGPVGTFLLRSRERNQEKLENVRRAQKRDLSFEENILQDIEYLKLLQELRKEYDDGR